MTTRISFCYYPTTVALLDDNKDFLETMELKLSKYVPLTFFDYPEKAKTYFDQNYKNNLFIDNCIGSNQDDNTDQLTRNIDLRNIYKKVYVPKRFSEISVLVVDYAMPNMNGVEFCRFLRQKYNHIKIILLTGEADQNIAVEAFNEGAIDKFILKSSKNLADTLLTTIQNLQQIYFKQLSNICFSQTEQFKGILNCLDDSVFINMFEKICKDNQIVEYYLLDKQGSFLLLNMQGRASWLIVNTAKEIENFYQYALLEQAPHLVIDSLQNKQSVLYFHTDDDLKTPPDQWQKYLHTAQVLIGKETYYYTYLSGNSIYKLETKKILPYQQYLQEEH